MNIVTIWMKRCLARAHASRTWGHNHVEPPHLKVEEHILCGHRTHSVCPLGTRAHPLLLRLGVWAICWSPPPHMTYMDIHVSSSYDIHVSSSYDIHVSSSLAKTWRLGYLLETFESETFQRPQHKGDISEPFLKKNKNHTEWMYASWGHVSMLRLYFLSGISVGDLWTKKTPYSVYVCPLRTREYPIMLRFFF